MEEQSIDWPSEGARLFRTHRGLRDLIDRVEDGAPWHDMRGLDAVQWGQRVERLRRACDAVWEALCSLSAQDLIDLDTLQAEEVLGRAAVAAEAEAELRDLAERPEPEPDEDTDEPADFSPWSDDRTAWAVFYSDGTQATRLFRTFHEAEESARSFGAPGDVVGPRVVTKAEYDAIRPRV